MDNGFADIHSHILPGVDDGSSNIEKSMKMFDIAYNEGTRLLFLTPHYMKGRYDVRFSKLMQIFDDLKSRLSLVHPDLRIELGREIWCSYYEPSVLDDIDKGICGDMAGSGYIMVEFSPSTPWDEMIQSFRELSNRGHKVILAHVERYVCLRGKIDRIDSLLNANVLLQTNASALVRYGLRSRSPSAVSHWNRKLVLEGLISFIGSDAHDIEWRAPLMRKCSEWVMKKLPADEAYDILYGNALRLVEGDL